jgi:hypothetical protein
MDIAVPWFWDRRPGFPPDRLIKWEQTAPNAIALLTGPSEAIAGPSTRFPDAVQREAVHR